MQILLPLIQLPVGHVICTKCFFKSTTSDEVIIIFIYLMLTSFRKWQNYLFVGWYYRKLTKVFALMLLRVQTKKQICRYVHFSSVARIFLRKFTGFCWKFVTHPVLLLLLRNCLYDKTSSIKRENIVHCFNYVH